MFKKMIKKAVEIDNALSNNYEIEDINAEVARNNYQIYQAELKQREQNYINKWNKEIKTASREGAKYIFTNSFLINNVEKILLVCGDDGCIYEFPSNSSIRYLKEYYEDKGFNVVVQKDNNSWCRLMISWLN